MYLSAQHLVRLGSAEAHYIPVGNRISLELFARPAHDGEKRGVLLAALTLDRTEAEAIRDALSVALTESNNAAKLAAMTPEQRQLWLHVSSGRFHQIPTPLQNVNIDAVPSWHDMMHSTGAHKHEPGDTRS